jgi:hypothetical protein
LVLGRDALFLLQDGFLSCEPAISSALDRFAQSESMLNQAYEIVVCLTFHAAINWRDRRRQLVQLGDEVVQACVPIPVNRLDRHDF